MNERERARFPRPSSLPPRAEAALFSMHCALYLSLSPTTATKPRHPAKGACPSQSPFFSLLAAGARQSASSSPPSFPAPSASEITEKKMLALHCMLLQLLSLALVFGLTVTGQEAFELVHLQTPNSDEGQPSVGISVNEANLAIVSTAVLAAETWLRSNVLSRYPSTRITTVIVGKGIRCRERRWDLVLPSVKNLHYSLTRWGLLKEIQVSAAFSADCLLERSRRDVLEPVLRFLRESGSAYAVDESSDFPLRDAWKSLSLSGLDDVRVVKKGRKLSSATQPLAEMPKPPGDLQVPSHLAKNPTPPPIIFPPPPGSSFTFPPYAAPAPIPPANQPDAFPASPPPSLSPCMPMPSSAPAPASGLWCVAKPTVPVEKLQEAMDYACGAGEADCGEIGPDGSCYYPDSVVAHASYAFNSYWQRTKRSGGSCSFDGTAVLINSDPSFLGCHFELS